jgi:hypothetical protein
MLQLYIDQHSEDHHAISLSPSSLLMVSMPLDKGGASSILLKYSIEAIIEYFKSIDDALPLSIDIDTINNDDGDNDDNGYDHHHHRDDNDMLCADKSCYTTSNNKQDGMWKQLLHS